MWSEQGECGQAMKASFWQQVDVKERTLPSQLGSLPAIVFSMAVRQQKLPLSKAKKCDEGQVSVGEHHIKEICCVSCIGRMSVNGDTTKMYRESKKVL